MIAAAQVVAATDRWIREFVVAMNLCPFARSAFTADSVRYQLCDATDAQGLLEALARELAQLQQEPQIETGFLIHPLVMQDFLEYNQFLDLCDALLAELDLVGVYQLASFHPQYQFAGTAANAAENYSNRSPYPMLHLLREASVERAVDTHPDVEGIPMRNIALLSELGEDALHARWRACFDTPVP